MASVVANGGLGSSVAVGTCRLGISPKGTVRGQTCRPNGEVPNSTVLTCGSLTCRRTSQEIAWVVAESKTTTSFISPT